MTPAILRVVPTSEYEGAPAEHCGLVLTWFRPDADGGTLRLLCVPQSGPDLEGLSSWDFAIRSIARSCKAVAGQSGLDAWQVLLQEAMRAVVRGLL